MAGRKRKDIDQKQFESLCAIQCTQEEICSVLDCADKTLQRWCRDTYGAPFKQVYKDLRASGNASLRRAQWHMAQTVPTMAIWLGKQHLKQEENAQLMEIKRKELELKEREFELKAKLIEAQLEEFYNEDDIDTTFKVEIVRASEKDSDK